MHTCFLEEVDLKYLFTNTWALYERFDSMVYILVERIKEDKLAIKKFWRDNPDLRFSQVLIIMNYMQNIPGFWFYIEEDEILKRQQNKNA